MHERQHTFRQEGYIKGTANNVTEISTAFANLAQATVEDRAAVTNITTTNSTLKEQVALYINRLSTKEADNMALQTAMKNLQGEVKNLNTEFSRLKSSGHSDSAGATNMD